MDEIDQALARFMTCGPAHCVRESDCFKVARWALEHRRAASKAREDLQAGHVADVEQKSALEEIPHNAPHWESPRVFPDWDAA